MLTLAAIATQMQRECINEALALPTNGKGNLVLHQLSVYYLQKVTHQWQRQPDGPLTTTMVTHSMWVDL